MAWNQTLEARVAERTLELSLANQRLEQQASTDVLTGLANRRHAMLCLQADWPSQPEPGRSLACVMVDADGLKGVNDVHGHGAGDEVLRQVARALKGAARNDDTVCRLGGDEYLVISRQTTPEGALRLAEKLVQAVRELRVPLGTGVVWSGSVSVAQEQGARVGLGSCASLDDMASRRHSTCQAKVSLASCASILRRPPRWPSTSSPMRRCWLCEKPGASTWASR
jgi:diguanylate cyclase (GGDEF)-like protein